MATTRKGESAGSEKAEVTKQRRTRRKARLVSKALANIEKKLKADELKPTVGDLIRLVQLEKELQEEEEQPKEIKVSWIERDEKEHVSEE